MGDGQRKEGAGIIGFLNSEERGTGSSLVSRFPISGFGKHTMDLS